VIEAPALVMTRTGGIPPLVLAFDPWIGRLTADDYTLQISLVFKGEPKRQWQIQRSAKSNWLADQNGVLVEWGSRDPGAQTLSPGSYSIQVSDDSGLVIYQGEFRLVLPAE